MNRVNGKIEIPWRFQQLSVSISKMTVECFRELDRTVSNPVAVPVFPARGAVYGEMQPPDHHRKELYATD